MRYDSKALGHRVGLLPTATLVLLTLACSGDDGGAPEDPTGPGAELMADLAVNVVAPSNALVGATFSYTVEVSNAGPDPAEAVTASLELPASVEVEDVRDGGTLSGTTVTWSSGTDIPAGGRRSFGLSVRADREGPIEVVGRAASSTEDPDPSNNDGSGSAARRSTSVGIEADLALSVEAPGTVAAGEPVTYVISVENRGPSPANGVSVMDSLPENSRNVQPGGDGTVAGREVTWPVVATMEAGEVRTFAVEFEVPPVGPLLNQAAVVAASPDPDGSNNRIQSQTIIGFDLLYKLEGPEPDYGLGITLSRAGDLDGDGASDFVVYAKEPDHDGSLHVISGATGSTIRVLQGVDGGYMGQDHAITEDLDGDGVRELIVGEPGFDEDRGRIHVFSLATGSKLATLDGTKAGEFFGMAAGPAGDVNGDGVTDIVAGAPTHEEGIGRVDVFSGRDFTRLWSVEGDFEGGFHGQTARGIGDVDGDGRSDIVAAAPLWNGIGRLYVYSGADGAPVYEIPPPPESNTLGLWFLEGAGDINGDGVPDILVEDPAYDNLRGRAYVFSGRDGTIVHALAGDFEGIRLGQVRAAGDVDGDGVPDYTASAPQHPEGGERAGKAFVVSGSDGRVIRTITHDIPDERFGVSTIAIGDVNGDGLTDYALTGQAFTLDGRGVVYVIRGVPF